MARTGATVVTVEQAGDLRQVVHQLDLDVEQVGEVHRGARVTVNQFAVQQVDLVGQRSGDGRVETPSPQP